MGKSDRNFWYLLRNLRTKHRLSMRDQHNEAEVWYMYISPLNALAGILALVLVLFIIITLLVAYTPVLELVPGHPANRSREVMVESILKLDSIERELTNLQLYSDNVALIMEGKTPVTRTIAQSADTSNVAAGEIIKPSREDSLLRLQIESGGLYRLNSTQPVRGQQATAEMRSPVSGVLATRFNPKEGRFGVGVATAASEKIVAVESGTIVLAGWSPDEGYVVQIQHGGNLISTYKHAGRIIKNVGQRVQAGEVIGYTGEGVSGEAGKGYFEFELWSSGTPVDPEGYIVF